MRRELTTGTVFRTLLAARLSLAFLLILSLSLTSVADDGAPALEALTAEFHKATKEGRYDEAISAGLDALALAQRTIGADARETGSIHLDLAQPYFGQRDLKAAEDHLRKALAIFGKADGESSVMVGRALNNLAYVQTDLNEFEDAESNLRRAIQVYEALGEPEVRQLGTAHRNLGRLYRMWNRSEDAETSLKASLAIFEHAPEANDWLFDPVVTDLADLYQFQGRFEEAEERYRQSLGLRKARYGAESDQTVEALGRLANLFEGQSQWEQTVPIFREILAIFEARSNGSPPPEALWDLAQGLVFSDGKEEAQAEAEKLGRRALDLIRAANDERSVEVAEAHAKFALLTFTIKNDPVAEANFLRSRELFDALAPEGHVRAAQSTAYLAEIAKRRGDPEVAERYFVEALERYDRLGGPANPNWKRVAIELMRVLMERDRTVQADPVLARLVSAIGTEQEADRLLDDIQSWINEAFAAKRHDTALWLLERAIVIADRHTGAGHPKRASLQVDLGVLLAAKGRNADALAAYSRAVALYEKENNPDPNNLANAQSHLARLFSAEKREGEAAMMMESAIANGRRSATYPPHSLVDDILMLAQLRQSLGEVQAAASLFAEATRLARTRLGEGSLDFAEAQATWAAFLSGQGETDRSEELYRSGLSVQENAGRGETVETAIMDEGLAFLLLKRHRYAEALTLQQRALTIRVQKDGPDAPDMADNLILLGDIQSESGNADEALATYRRTLAIRESHLDPGDDRVIDAMRRLAAALIGQGYAEASHMRGQVLERLEQAGKSSSLRYAEALREFAQLQMQWNRLAEAEDLALRAREVSENAVGGKALDIVQSLETLVSVYLLQNRYLDAANLQLRLLAVLEQQSEAPAKDKADALRQLARIKHGLGEKAEAVRLIEKAFDVQSAAAADDPNARAVAFKDLGSGYFGFGRYDEAGDAYEQVLALHQKTLGEDHPIIAFDLLMLSVVQLQQGDPVGALNALQRGLGFLGKQFGPNHPIVSQLSSSLPFAYLAAGRFDEAERFLARKRESENGQVENFPGADDYYQAIIDAKHGRLEQALVGARKRLATKQSLFFDHSQSVRMGAATLRDPGRLDQLFLVSFLNEAAERWPDRRGEFMSEAFQVTQLGDIGATAGAVSQMAIRLGTGANDLGDLVRRRQDAADRWHYFNDQLLKEAGKSVSERTPEKEAAMHQKMVEASDLLDSLDGELQKAFPEYAELIKPRPASLAEIQRLLRSGEALLYYRSFDTSSPMMSTKAVQSLVSGKAILWVVRADRSDLYWIEGFDDDSERIAGLVAQLREGLDFAGRGAVRPGPKVSRARRFDLDAAHELYRLLLGPAAKSIEGADHLVFVLDGAMQSLPPAVLVTEAPPAIGSDADYRSVPWLIRDHAITVLPSVSSLAALRRKTRSSRGERAFVGIGDPLLAGHPSAALRPIQVASASQRGLVANVDNIRVMASLPETAVELSRIADALGADPDRDLVLREAATETEVKNRDLSPYRVVALATHGLMAGDLLKAIEEPALVLTPPVKGSEIDDGLLTASEIAQLRLDADWVILSACNTAAAAGSARGAEGLSGLVRAFFYAGARALLVSHWAVDSDATVLLTTGMFDALGRDPTIGRAEALRRSMMALMAHPERPEYAHPSFWAPFVVVGEGGANSVSP